MCLGESESRKHIYDIDVCARNIFPQCASFFFFFIIRGSLYYREWIFSSFFINRRRPFALMASESSIVIHRMLRLTKKSDGKRVKERKGEL